MEEMTEHEKLLRNLNDAGCDTAMVQKFFRLQEEGRRREQYQLLSAHRSLLLEQLHDSQQRIDCLDYLIYTMKKEQIQSK